MNLIYKLFRLDKNSREGVVSATSILNIIVNLFVALMKVIFGFFASSIAIISEGVNNATDALSSLLTLVGTRLANKRPDRKHPFGYGRIEYLTSLIISLLILFGGFEVLSSSIRLIFKPEELNISYVSLIVVALSAAIKFALGTYTIATGKKVGSTALEAVGVDCRNDSYVSLVTIASAVIFLVSGFSIDAYAGVFTSSLIIKAGFEILTDTVSRLLGQPADEELARSLYKEIRSTPGIINAVDMVLHNYGPDAYTGSVNVEIDHKKTVGEIYNFLRALQIRIYSEFKVAMVFGIYAVDADSRNAGTLRKQIADFVKDHEHIRSYHAIYADPESDLIYCDLVVDYEADYDEIRSAFADYLKKLYPDKQSMINIDTEFV